VTAAEVLAAGEGFNGESERRKRLGQYFTGIDLARLLAALAGAEKATSIVDPMAGSGDMLAACLDLGAKPNALGAVDIDPIAVDMCAKRVPDANCLLGSAFDPKVLSKLPTRQWDLVITNPPYVRYQSMARGAGKGFRLPSALEVRQGLLKNIAGLPALDDADRAVFERITAGYSGLADLAVPSWILCSAMVAPGGALALVVPEAWLSRDYAAVVHYLLLRWFQIEFIVEDEHAAWFVDTQVKTTLLVARRVPRRESAFGYGPNETFLRLRLSGRSIGSSGVVDRLYPDVADKEKYFAQQARSWLTSGFGYKGELIEATHVPLARVAANLRGVCARQKWFFGMEANTQPSISSPLIPQELASWLAQGPGGAKLTSLEDLGAKVGQGLRTGANAFFYTEFRRKGAGGVELEPDAHLGTGVVTVPVSCALPVLRRQSDLPKGYAVKASLLSGRVLDLRKYALPEDIKAGGRAARDTYTAMPKELAALVRSAARVNFGTDEDPRRIQELSAVAPNIRGPRMGDGSAPRFWYMLPDFAPRHKPDLLLARVNSTNPKTFLNDRRSAIVDANFVTIRINEKTSPDAYALLAFLNSSWCRAALELSAAIMGGGALKVEAAHIRRLPVPELDVSGWKSLSELGRKLAVAETKGTEIGLLDQVDYQVNSSLLGRSAINSDTEALRRLAAEGLHRRTNQKKRMPRT
jgi:predicted RNA methylase